MNEDLQFKAAMEESMKVTQKVAFFAFKVLPARCRFIDILPSSKVHTSPPAGSAEDAASSSYDADLQKTIEMSLRVGGSQAVIAFPDFGILQMAKQPTWQQGFQILKLSSFRHPF